MNAVEFVITLKDKASSTSQKIANEFRRIRTNADTLTGSINKLQAKGESLRIARDASTSISQIKKINTEIKKTENEVEKLENLGNKKGGLNNLFGGMGGMLSSMGVGFGLYQIGDMMRQGTEKAHELALAQAQVKTSLESTGYAAGVMYEDTLKQAKKLSSSTLFGRSEITDMQSMLLTFPSVSKKIFESASGAILDISTKMHQDVKMSTVMVGKALQDPAYGVMALRRVGVNLTKEQANIIKGLVASGHKDIAQAMILKELNTEFGGSAKAAFDATPLARYHKIIGSIQLSMGKLAEKVQEKLAPALEAMASMASKVLHPIRIALGWIFKELESGNPIVVGIVSALGAFAVIIGGISIATAIWTGIQWALNTSLFANPIVWIVAIIIGLIAAIYAVTQMTTGWGKTWDNIITWMKLGTHLFVAGFKGEWLMLKDYFLSGLEIIEKGWYKLQSLWDKNSANKGLANLTKQRNDRAGEIAKAKGEVDKLSNLMATMKVWEVKSNGKTFKSVAQETKKKLGLGGGDEGGTNNKANNSGTAQAVASGGTRNTSITIHLGKMVENIIFQGGIKENTEDMIRQVEEALVRTLAAAQSAS